MYFITKIVFVMCVIVSSQCQNMGTFENSTICGKCECSQSKVDCHDKDIRASFTAEEWTEIETLPPADVDLSHNSIHTLAAFPPLLILTLNISNSNLVDLDSFCFANLADLESLDLSNNKLSAEVLFRKIFVPKHQSNASTKPYTRWRRLTLANNAIYSLPQDVFRYLDQLTHLDLSGNPLKYIDQVTMAALSGLTVLKELRLSNCLLETLPEGILRRQRGLQVLDVSGNQFTTVPSALGEATGLVSLKLDRCAVERIEAGNVLKQLTYLEELSICLSRRLQSIEANALGGLKRLKVLKIDYNPRLSDLDPTFLAWTDEHGVERWPILNELHLSNNNLSSISSTTLDRWDQLQRLDVSNNPYACDCNNQWMVDALIPLLENTSLNGSSANMVCKSPPDLRGLTFKYLRDTGAALPCEGQSENVTMFDADSVVLFGVMIGVFVTFPVVIILVSLWKRGFFSRFRRNVVEKSLYDEETDCL